MNTFFIKTFGCKLNQYESQLIRENLIKNSWLEAYSIEGAEYLIVNSCAVTARGIKELRKFVRSSRSKNPELKVIVTGCVVEIYPDELNGLPLFKIVPNKNKYRIPDIISSQSSICLDKISNFNGHTRAFVKIQDGCNNHCTYCCSRLARGMSRSREPEKILEEISALLINGYKEIVLTGLCLGDFGKDIGFSLAGLLQKIESFNFDFRLRLSSIEPQDVTDELIFYVEKAEKTVPHLHVSLQSGSDKILRLMRRKYTAGFFKNRISRLKAVPKFQFSTDIIVGFPQESEEDFKMTLALLNELSPVRVHVFPFSPRPDTEAYSMDGRIPFDAVNDRKKAAQHLVEQIVMRNLKNQVGGEFTILCEQKRGVFWSGYTENYMKVEFKDDRDFKNQFVSVKTYRINEEKPVLLARLH